MKIFGVEITRSRRPATAQNASPVLTNGGGGWWPLIIREPWSGAWQHNKELRPETLLAFYAVYACITLISADIGKLGLGLLQRDENDIWTEIQNPAYSPVLNKPNRYQTRIQFVENWIMSKLTRGNTYVLKERDERGVVNGLYILDTQNVQVLVTPSGDVYYELSLDNLSGLNETSVTVPASEIIHDRMNCLYHPLVGTSPLYASALAARQGLAIQNNSVHLFENGVQPGGILVAPGAISDESAKRLKEHWDSNYSGTNRGKIAVIGDNLKFQSLAMNAVDSQLIEQARMNAEIVCSVFHVPAYMVGVGPVPSFQNVEALAQIYYSQCLQSLIEAFELCLDEGLGLSRNLKIAINLDGLLRMDSQALVKTLADGVSGGIFSPNEARKRMNHPPVQGGQSPYLQQQNFSLAALDRRDSNNPFPGNDPTPAPDDDDDQIRDVGADLWEIYVLSKTYHEAMQRLPL